MCHYKPRLVYFLPPFSVWFIINYITDNLCTKHRNLDLKSAVFNQERVIMAGVQYKKPIEQKSIDEHPIKNGNESPFRIWK